MNDKMLPLKKFEIKTLIVNDENKFINPKIILIGKTGGGKSWLIKDIMYNLGLTKIPCGIVVAPTDKMTKFYNNFVPPSFIFHKFDIEILRNIFIRQKNILKKNEERKKNNKKLIDPRIFLILDDCMADGDKWIKDELIKGLFFEGRHYFITFILSMQYGLGLTTELRTNVDFIFLLRDNINSNKERLYKHYAGMFPNQQMFNKIFSQVTGNYKCMVINNRSNPNNDSFANEVFWYKAENLLDKNFIIGCEKYIKFNNDNYDEDYENKNYICDVNNFNLKKENLVVKFIGQC